MYTEKFVEEPPHSTPVRHAQGKICIFNLPLLHLVCFLILSCHFTTFQVPQLAAALMPICEAFGSCVPNVSWTAANGEKLSCHAVFSNAFILLLRLWRFNHPPVEHVMGGAAATPALGSQLGPEYLLLVRNSMLASFGKSPRDRLQTRRFSKMISFSSEPVFMDSFPKLNIWYRQHQECLASTRSALAPGGSVLQIVDALLSMMCRKISKSAQSLTPTTSGSSNSSGSSLDDILMKLKVPAWDILEAAPFVLDAALTACAHGRLSPRELATGLPSFLVDVFMHFYFAFSLCIIDNSLSYSASLIPSCSM